MRLSSKYKSPTLSPKPFKSWLFTQGGSSHTVATHSQTDASGNTYVLGNFQNIVFMGTHTLESQQKWGLYIAKISHTGSFAWVKTIGLKPKVQAEQSMATEVGLALDSNNNVTIAINTKAGTLQFGKGKPQTTDGSPWLAKLDTNGQFLWTQQLNKIQSVGLLRVAPTTGDIYVRGQLNTSTTFGSSNLSGQGRSPALFVGAVSADGKPLWALQGGPIYSRSTPAFNMAVDAKGNLWFAGRPGTTHLTFRGGKIFRSSNLGWSFLAKSSNGYLSWHQEGAYDMSFRKIQTGNDNLELVGTAYREVTFGKVKLARGGFYLNVAGDGTIQEHQSTTINLTYNVSGSFFRDGKYVFLGQSTYPITLGKTKINVSQSQPYYLGFWNPKNNEASGKQLFLNGQHAHLHPAPSKHVVLVGHNRSQKAALDIQVQRFDLDAGYAKTITVSKGLPTIQPIKMKVLSNGTHVVLAKVNGKTYLRWLSIETKGKERNVLFGVSPGGKVQWAYYFPGNDFTIDKDDNICLFGLSKQPMEVTKDIKIPGWRLFVAKWDKKGQFHHLQTTKFSGSIDPQLYALDIHGNFYVAGLALRSLTVGDIPAKPENLYLTYVAKISPLGKVLWLAGGGPRQQDNFQGLAVDPAGYIYLGGVTFSQETSFGDLKLPAQSNKWSRPKGMLVLSPNGKFHSLSVQKEGIWDCKTVQLTPAFHHGAVVTGHCPYGLPGQKGSTSFAARFKTDASKQWLHVFQGTNPLQPFSVSFDPKDNTILAGNFEGSLTLGKKTLRSKGKSDIFLGWVNSKGEWFQSTSFGSKNDDLLTSLSIRVDHLSLLGTTRSAHTWKSLTFEPEKGNPLFLLGTTVKEILSSQP